MEESLVLKTVSSLKGHDTLREYVVLSRINDDFVLVADGKYRKLSNPKLKRIKHLKIKGIAGLEIEGLTDAKIRKALGIK